MAFKSRRVIVDDIRPSAKAALRYSQRQLDGALNGLTDAIASNAEAFPYVPGNHPIRLGKTRLVIRDLEIYLPLHLRFYIGNDDKVHLWHVELAPMDDPQFDDEPGNYKE